MDLLEQGHTEDGLYIINPNDTQPFTAFCDMTSGGWTLLQRRVDDSVDFYRGWDDYVSGFGDLCGSFWAGLNHIHALTSLQPTEFLVSMETFENEIAYAHYTSFSVSDAASGYKLSVSGYYGTAGDSMYRHNQQKFSTYDHDEDTISDNCAVLFKGGWWYSFCHQANPNGFYLHGASTTFGQGINWVTFKGYEYSMKTIELKVRRV